MRRKRGIGSAKKKAEARKHGVGIDVVPHQDVAGLKPREQLPALLKTVLDAALAVCKKRRQALGA